MTSRVLKSGIAALALIGVSIPMAAMAGSPDTIEIAGVRVSFADLDIHREEGAKALYSRLVRATEAACDVASLSELGSIQRVADARACFEATLSLSVEKLDSPALSRLHKS